MKPSNSFDEYIENAIIWARARLGSPHYPVRCLAFVEDAYEKSNRVEIFGGDTAKESAVEYQVTGSNGIPPKGSFVFYDCFGSINGIYKNWGHVGLALEAGQVIHAWQVVRIDRYLDIENLDPSDGWTKARYIGWAPVERIFRGARIL